MESNDLLDKEIPKRTNHKFWSIRLLVIAGALVFVVFAFAILWEFFALHVEQTVWLGVALLLSFVLNIAGFTIGFLEIHKNKLKARIGIIGNLLLILILLVIVYFSLSMVE